MFGDSLGRAVFKSATSEPEASRLPNDWHPVPFITVPPPGQLRERALASHLSGETTHRTFKPVLPDIHRDAQHMFSYAPHALIA